MIKQKIKKCWRLTIVVLFTIPTQIFAGEVRISTGLAAYKSVFEQAQKPFLEKTGHKLVFVVDPEKAGLEVVYGAFIKGEADLVPGYGGWEVWSKQLKEKGYKEDFVKSLANRLIGSDNLKVVVHKSTAVNSLTKEQVAKVFSGEIQNWKEVGGADQKIIVQVQDALVATNDFFKRSVFSPSQGFVKTAEHSTDLPAMIAKTASTPGSVAFASAYADTSSLQDIKLPTTIGRAILGVTKGKPNEPTEALLRFLTEKLQK